MAIRYAVATGNWSATSTWDGTATIPSSGDTVVANGFTVTINQNVTVVQVQTAAAGGGAAGGGFVLADGFTLNAIVLSGSTTCVTFSAASPASSAIVGSVTAGGSGAGVAVTSTGTLAITGNILGGTGSAATGITVSGAATVNVTGNVTAGTAVNSTVYGMNISANATVNITGNVSAGNTNDNCAGIINSAASATINITGNVSATVTGTGSNRSQHGIDSQTTSAITVTGTVTGSQSASNAVAYGIYTGTSNANIVVNGPVVASYAAGVYTSSVLSYVAARGPFTASGAGVMPIFSPHFALAPSSAIATTSFIFAGQGTTVPNYSGTRTMYTAGVSIGNPATADVRNGTTFGAASELTGTLKVPSPSYVSQGVQTDATVGTLTSSSPSLLIQTTIATLSSQTSFTLTAGSTRDNSYVNQQVVVTSAGDSTKKAVGTVSAYTGSSKTVTLAVDPAIYTMAIGDSIAIVAGPAGLALGNDNKPLVSNDSIWNFATRTLSAFGFTVTTDSRSDVTAIKAKTDNLPASPAAVGSQMDLVNAPNATALTAFGTAVWAITTRTLSAFGFTVNTNANATETAIKAKTDNLPASPADETLIIAATNSIMTAVGNPMQAGATVNTNPNSTETAIKAKTDQLTFTVSGHVDATATVDSTAIADAVVAGIEGADMPVTISSFSDEALLAMRTNLNGSSVRVSGPIYYNGPKGPSITLTIGDDYAAADGRQIDIDLDGTTLPDLTDATCYLVCSSPAGSRRALSIAGEITVPTGTTRTARFEPTSTQTRQLLPTVDGEYFVTLVTAALTEITPFDSRGTLTVLMGREVCA